GSGVGQHQLRRGGVEVTGHTDDRQGGVGLDRDLVAVAGGGHDAAPCARCGWWVCRLSPRISARTASRRSNRSWACWRYRSIHFVIRSKTSASRWHGRRWASLLWLTSPASASTLMCLDTAWTDTSYGSASSPTVASPTARRATMSRLVGSARAAKTRDSWSSGTSTLCSTEWLNT